MKIFAHAGIWLLLIVAILLAYTLSLVPWGKNSSHNGPAMSTKLHD